MTPTEVDPMDTKNDCDVREMIAETRPLLDGNMHESAEMAAALALQNTTAIEEGE